MDETSVSKIIKIAMINNEKCNTCIFRGKCFFAYSCLSNDYLHYKREELNSYMLYVKESTRNE